MKGLKTNRSISRINCQNYNPKEAWQSCIYYLRALSTGKHHESCQLQSHSPFATINKQQDQEVTDMAQHCTVLPPLSHFTFSKWMAHILFFSAGDLFLIIRSYIMSLHLLIQWWLGNALVGFSAVNFIVSEPAKCEDSLVRMWTTIIESCLPQCPDTYSVPNIYINYLAQRFILAN